MRSASCQSTRSATRLVDPRVLRLDDLAQVEHHDHDGGGDDQRDHEDQGDPPVPDDCEHGPTLCPDRAATDIAPGRTDAKHPSTDPGRPATWGQIGRASWRGRVWQYE